jgi:hypothetical protein
MCATIALGMAVDENNAPATQARGRFQVRVAFIVAMILIFPLLVFVAYFATRNVLPELSQLKFAFPQSSASITTQTPSFNNTSLNQATSQLFPSSSPSSLPYLSSLLNLPRIDLVEVLLIVTAVVAVLIVSRSLSTRRRPTTPFEDDEDLLANKRREMAAILDAAAARLNAGSSYRETVIQCYKMIGELLEEKSDVDGRVLTAREFKTRVSERLKIDTPYLAQVTQLFEVARYSEQEITREQAQEAAACLSNLSAPLKEPVVSGSDIK